jgi:acetoacetyl-CoA synthetase
LLIAVLPNRIECLAILLGTASIGAIFSSTSPDMGAVGIVERYSQVRPTVLICDTAVTYGGKRLDLCSRLAEANKELRGVVPELAHTIVVNGPVFEGVNVQKAADVLDFLETSSNFEQLPFDHPVYILYSSGTTGAPKCITHGAGTALLQQKKELLIGSNHGPHSVLYQYTTTGWMMWNWAIAILSLQGRIVLFDGSPLHPTPASQLEIVRREGYVKPVSSSSNS